MGNIFLMKENEKYYIKDDKYTFEENTISDAFLRLHSINENSKCYIYNQTEIIYELISLLKHLGFIDDTKQQRNFVPKCFFRYSIIESNFYTLKIRTQYDFELTIYDLKNIFNVSDKKLFSNLFNCDVLTCDVQTKLDNFYECINIINELGLRESTIASCAWKDFNSIKTTKWVRRNIIFNREVDDSDFRRAYKTGMVYLKKPGFYKKHITTYDINASYVYLLSEDKIFDKDIVYPTNSFVEYNYKTLSTIRKKCLHESMASNPYIIKLSCYIEVKPGHMPTLSVNDTADYSPLDLIEKGNIFTCLTKIDYEMLLENYNISDLEIFRVWVFDSIKPSEFTRDYMQKWYSKELEYKEKGDKIRAYVCKMMRNSLTGRFGLNSDLHKYLFDNQGIKEDFYRKTNLVNTAIAAFFTSYARWYLWKLCIPYYQEDRLYYTDTDCLQIEGDLLPETKSLLGREMGKLKVELESDISLYIQQKMYIKADSRGTITKVAIAGLNENGQDWLLGRDIHSIVDGVDIPEGRTVKIRKGFHIDTSYEVFRLRKSCLDSDIEEIQHSHALEALQSIDLSRL